MALETVAPDAEAQERAIRAAADKLISNAAAKHGLTIEDIPEATKREAYAYARNAAVEEARKRENPYVALYEDQRKENELLKAQLGAIKTSRDSASTSSTYRAPITMEIARGQMGRDAWFQLTDAQKVQSVGWTEPVDRDELRRLFAVGSDTHFAVDYQKAQPVKYSRLREVAKALGIYGSR